MDYLSMFENHVGYLGSGFLQLAGMYHLTDSLYMLANDMGGAQAISSASAGVLLFSLGVTAAVCYRRYLGEDFIDLIDSLDTDGLESRCQ